MEGEPDPIFGSRKTLTIVRRYRSRADFDKTDFRLLLPRFSEENFAKNVALVDKFEAIAKKLNATASQVALAWILAEHPNCT